jgi:hypothetical protein
MDKQSAYKIIYNLFFGEPIHEETILKEEYNPRKRVCSKNGMFFLAEEIKEELSFKRI